MKNRYEYCIKIKEIVTNDIVVVLSLEQGVRTQEQDSTHNRTKLRKNLNHTNSG